MYLKQLKIHTLPGIEPGFVFAPAGEGVNIVTGPNAIGKSSLERALGYLLRGARREDPIALSLEAELVSSDSTWRVRRNGSQIVWYRNGSAATRPALPGALHTGLYRLSVEHLLAEDDPHDKDLAQSLRNSLLGNFDLDEPRLELRPRFAQTEEKKLLEAQQNLRQTERDYDTLEQELEELPRLAERINAAEQAENRREHLQQGLALHAAMAASKTCAGALEVFPQAMEKLRGNELERLESLEKNQGSMEEKLRAQQRRLERAETVLAGTDLQQSEPDPQSLDAMELHLRQLGQKVADRNSARKALDQAGGGLKKALEPFNDGGKPPRLDAQSLSEAEHVATPLIGARVRQQELQQKLKLAGEPPDEAEINKLYEAGGALREWLAAAAAESGSQPAASGRRTRLALWLTLVASGLAAALAGMQQALFAMGLALVAFGAAMWGLFNSRISHVTASLAVEAKKRFIRTGLAGPPDWSDASVQEYLRTQVEVHYSARLLQRERAAQAGDFRLELEKIEATIAELQARKQAVARELGFNPELPSISPDIFLQHCRQLLEAEDRHAQAQAGLDAMERDIAADAAVIRDFLNRWRSKDAPAHGEAEDEADINLLQASFQALKKRSTDARDARKDITRYQDDIRSLKAEIEGSRDEIRKLFSECGLDFDDRNILEQRLGQLPAWQLKRKELDSAEFEEKRVRALLEACPEIVKYIEQERITDLQNDLTIATEQAGEYKQLIEQRAAAKTRLDEAGADHRLSQARAAADAAKAALEDKREQSWLFEATELLLDDVEQTYQTEHVPPTLKTAQALFKSITHGAFDLHLEKDGTFSARDLRQNAPRGLKELSSGTRMQLLLALRLAWTEAQEQGGETLPLFLDEALTTSDEDRFMVMANSLERLAETEGRQIFYLSARRHEYALWRQATGNEPPVIDLAAVRFPQEGRPPQDYDIALPPAVPSPAGREPGDYASALGVPLPNPRQEPGATHLFYLLRDDLELLYQLMDTWRISSLGQLEALLDSDAAASALADNGLRDRLRLRCAVVHAWTLLWRRGRGKPVDRIALEQSDVISDRFMDRVTNLAEDVNEDGKALTQALRAGQVSGFRTGKIEELERWLAEEGYTEQEEILSAEARRRQTLQQVMTNRDADVDDVKQQINWLESTTS